MDILLREIRRTDLEQIMKWLISPEITRFMKIDPVLTTGSGERWFEKIVSDETAKHWMIEVDGNGAGIIYLKDIDWKQGKSSWGYSIWDKNACSTQLAVSLEMSLYDYVFDILDFQSIHNEVFSVNAEVIKIHKLCGCEIEKVLEREIEKDGEWHDVTCLNIGKEKWLSIREAQKYINIDYNRDKKLHHIGFAVRDINESVKKFEMGGYRRVTKIIDDVSRQVRIAFICGKSDGTLIELVSPISEDSPVSKTLAVQKGVATPYHFCYEVENVKRMIQQLKRQSYYMVKPMAPAIAINGRNVAFMINRDVGLIELVERRENGTFY